MKVELIIEGGGMRGAYSAGVLDYFIDADIKFNDIVGVSSGVAVALNYVSGQKGRNLEIFTKYANDKRYFGVESFIRTGSMFGLDFIFKTIPTEYLPFDYDSFKNSGINLTAVVTDLQTGKAHYELIDDLHSKIDYAIASASLPMISKTVRIDGLELLDGGIADPIPIKHSRIVGFNRQVLVLTRNEGYRKNRRVGYNFLIAKYIRYRNFIHTLRTRHHIYNSSLDFAEELEKLREAVIIRPSQPLTIDRFERNPDRLKALYDLGYNDAKAKYSQILEICKSCENIEY